MSEMCPYCNKDVRKFYVVQFKGSHVLHAMTTKFSGMGIFGLDQMFGGGMEILCGRPTEGLAKVSEKPVPAQNVTCKKCQRKMGSPSPTALVPGPHLSSKERKIVAVDRELEE